MSYNSKHVPHRSSLVSLLLQANLRNHPSTKHQTLTMSKMVESRVCRLGTLQIGFIVINNFNQSRKVYDIALSPP